MKRPKNIPYGRKVRLLEDYELVPDQTIGIVEEGPYIHGIFDYTKECPVQFGIKNPNIAETLGVPWKLLEFVI